MKKSNALMLSYIVFLVITVIANLVYGWEGISQIALAASAAGFFFAFADLSNWYVSCLLPHSEMFLENIKYLKKYDTAIDSLDNNTKKQAKEALDTLEPYVEVDPCIAEFVQECKDTLARLEQSTSPDLELKKQVEELLTQSEKTVTKINHYKFGELGFAYLGFLVFFSLTSFDALVENIRPYESLITVAAFIIIMLTYYLRDTIDEKVKSRCEELQRDTEKIKLDIAEMEQRANRTYLTDTAKELSEMLKNDKTVEEEIENG